MLGMIAHALFGLRSSLDEIAVEICEIRLRLAGEK